MDSIDAELAAMRGLVRQDRFADALAAGKALIARVPVVVAGRRSLGFFKQDRPFVLAA